MLIPELASKVRPTTPPSITHRPCLSAKHRHPTPPTRQAHPRPRPRRIHPSPTHPPHRRPPKSIAIRTHAERDCLPCGSLWKGMDPLASQVKQPAHNMKQLVDGEVALPTHSPSPTALNEDGRRCWRRARAVPRPHNLPASCSPVIAWGLCRRYKLLGPPTHNPTILFSPVSTSC